MEIPTFAVSDENEELLGLSMSQRCSRLESSDRRNPSIPPPCLPRTNGIRMASGLQSRRNPTPPLETPAENDPGPSSSAHPNGGVWGCHGGGGGRTGEAAEDRG